MKDTLIGNGPFVIKTGEKEFVSAFGKTKSGLAFVEKTNTRMNAKIFRSIGQAKQCINLFGGIIHNA